jgi:hypothetical protein
MKLEREKLRGRLQKNVFGRKNNHFYPVRNNAPLLSSPAIAGLGFMRVPAAFNAPLEFLTGFTLKRRTAAYLC